MNSWDLSRQIIEIESAKTDAIIQSRLREIGWAPVAETASELESLRAENEWLRDALHQISLCAQNSMSTKSECGKIARKAQARRVSDGHG